MTAPAARSLRQVSLYFALIGLVCLAFADIDITHVNPWHEVGAMARGFISPSVQHWPRFFQALLNTLAFAVQGITLAAMAGFTLALWYRKKAIRLMAAFLRSIHEVFWALLFIQIFGLTSLAGLLALVLPYTGTLTKIYGEQLEEIDPKPALACALTAQQSFSHFLFTKLPLVWAPMRHYTSYRLECALRSSIVLGFIGLPTLGFLLETALRQGNYSHASALIYALICLVVSLRFWLKPLMLLFAIPALFYLVPIEFHWDVRMAQQFLGDLLPTPWRYELSPAQSLQWWLKISAQQILPGLFNTVLLAQIVLLLTGILSLLWLPLNSPLFLRPGLRRVGDAWLILLRTLPEYLLNFLGLLLLGPSMLPAILAMGLHNGAIIAHLLGQHSSGLPAASFDTNTFSRFCFYVVPSLYRSFLAYLLYRWEIIIRETAMLGILGIPTLGFYIDSAFEALRFDVAWILIAVSSLLTLGADHFAHKLRGFLALKTTPETNE
ncbi:ABC transporter permease [Simiduia curdlanivorans]|uniref:PhnE/PtxC family ABC transporter permease n=1 Tax=Simiduia curdlanivorans TaxID=1492769 RepID=A0ABV8V3L6_9GAMM|nr:ABC transporter permease [Simiduia curdlanivorans]MDN3638172.1 ABC transporter permease [Simiduia curdlanivorans]